MLKMRPTPLSPTVVKMHVNDPADPSPATEIVPSSPPQAFSGGGGGGGGVKSYRVDADKKQRK